MTSAQVKAKATELGFCLVGVCRSDPPDHLDFYQRWLDKGYHGSMSYLASQTTLKADPKSLLPSVRTIIAVGLNYYQPLDGREGYPRIARYALGRDYHKVLRSKLTKLGKWLTIQAPETEFRACVDSAPIFEREYAHQAGLGWYGKNTCLINTTKGSWFVIGLLLVNLELEPDLPAKGQCGSCLRCVNACPNGAIVFEDGRWQVDSRRCISYLTIEAPLESPELNRAGWTFGCDICQEVCPFNRHQTVTTEPDFLKTRPWPSISELQAMNVDEWDQLTQGSPVRRAGIEGFKANLTNLA